MTGMALGLRITPLGSKITRAATRNLNPLLRLLADENVTNGRTLIGTIYARRTPLMIIATRPGLNSILGALIIPSLLKEGITIMISSKRTLNGIIRRLLTNLNTRRRVLVIRRIFRRAAPLLTRQTRSTLIVL